MAKRKKKKHEQEKQPKDVQESPETPPEPAASPAAAIIDAPPEEEEKLGGLELLREYQNVIIAVILLAGAITLVTSWYFKSEEQHDEQAWNRYSELVDKRAQPEAFEALAKEFAGTEATPYMLLERANVLYERGGQANLEEALSICKGLRQDYPQLHLVCDICDKRVAKIEAELANPLFLGEGAPAESPAVGPGAAPPVGPGGGEG